MDEAAFDEDEVELGAGDNLLNNDVENSYLLDESTKLALKVEDTQVRTSLGDVGPGGLEAGLDTLAGATNP